MDTPELAHLMGAYFHQDYAIYDGTIWGPLTQYLADSSPDERGALAAEVDVVLQQLTSEHEIDGYLEQLSSAIYRADEPGGYRGWLEEIARRVEASLAP